MGIANDQGLLEAERADAKLVSTLDGDRGKIVALDGIGAKRTEPKESIQIVRCKLQTRPRLQIAGQQRKPHIISPMETLKEIVHSRQHLHGLAIKMGTPELKQMLRHRLALLVGALIIIAERPADLQHDLPVGLTMQLHLARLIVMPQAMANHITQGLTGDIRPDMNKRCVDIEENQLHVFQIYDLCRSCRTKTLGAWASFPSEQTPTAASRSPTTEWHMTNRARIVQRACIAAIAIALTQNACRTDTPVPEPDAGHSGKGIPAADSQSPPLDTATMPDSTGAISASGVPGPGPGATESTSGWKRTELVQGMQRFITAIDSGDREMFWSALSERSLSRIGKGQLGTREEIWTAARQTLGDIEDRRITVIGGSHDSVALRIDGRRLIDSMREEDPIIVHLLREHNIWKVMYPGLLYPMHHLRK